MSRIIALALLAACNNGQSNTPPKGGETGGDDTSPPDTDDTGPVGTSGCTDAEGPGPAARREPVLRLVGSWSRSKAEPRFCWWTKVPLRLIS